MWHKYLTLIDHYTTPPEATTTITKLERERHKERERVCVCVWTVKLNLYSQSRLHVLLCTYCGVCCVWVCVRVPLFSYSAKFAFSSQLLDLPFSWTITKTLFSYIAKGFIFSSLVSFGDLSMLHFGLDQSQIWVIMLEDAPWFAKKKKGFCFMSWASFPHWICFLSGVVPYKSISFLQSGLLVLTFALSSTLCFL